MPRHHSHLKLVDKALAAKIAFDKTIQSRCITQDGDVYDPMGTMTGGAAQHGGGRASLLEAISALNALKGEWDACQAILGPLLVRTKEAKLQDAEMRRVENDLEMKQHAVSLVKERLKSDPAVRVRRSRCMSTVQDARYRPWTSCPSAARRCVSCRMRSCPPFRRRMMHVSRKLTPMQRTTKPWETTGKPSSRPSWWRAYAYPCMGLMSAHV